MTTLSEIDKEKNFIKAGILENQWWGERRLPVVCNRREVMRYIERLEEICSETYQVVGVLSFECGMFEDPQTQRVLDNLSQLTKVHETVLPYVLKHEREEVR